MKIIINDATTIRQVQEQFHLRYPYLKLEFFQGRANSVNRITTTASLLSGHGAPFLSGIVFISPTEKVAVVEQLMQERFGLSVQVFRKSGNAWLMTSSTDNLSLSEQNEIGKEMDALKVETETIDIHEQE